MKTAIHYINRDTPGLEGFHHASIPVLFGIDRIGILSDCPFPLKTDTFEVLAYGTTDKRDAETRYGHAHTFVVVRFIKGCGHMVEERIPFSEGVSDFDHYGTKFTGAHYSVSDWANRIERFRNYPCDVCGMVEHALWIWTQGLGVSSRAKSIARCVMLLDANYANWREFIPESEVVARFTNAKRGQDNC